MAWLRSLVSLCFIALSACASTDTGQHVASPAIAVTGVTVIDVTATDAVRSRLSNQTVVIQGGKITSAGAARSVQVPRGARTVDGRGRFLVPGLWDNHTHITMFGDAALPLFVSQGVTSIRDMGGVPSILSTLQRSVADDERTGPRIFFSGAIIEGAWWLDPVSRAIGAMPDLAYFPFLGVSPRLRMGAPSEASALVEQIKQSGAVIVKFRNLREPEVRAVAAEAARQGLLLVGHLPSGMDPAAAAEAGMVSIEHMDSVSRGLGDASETDRLRQFQRMAAVGTFITASMVADVAYRQTPDEHAYLIINDHENKIDPRRRFLPSLALAAWRFGLDIKRLEGPGGDYAALHRRQLADLKLAHAAGVRILVGTDIPVSLLFPGFSVHEEMAYLVGRAGMTPLEALKGATQYAALAMRDQDSGQIAAGKRADLLLLRSDPLLDISATRDIEAVFLNGRYFNQSQLQKLQEESATLARQQSETGK
jgi:imidazolonepropionase-like amidohydrolase